jgi:diguanylate cyclase
MLLGAGVGLFGAESPAPRGAVLALQATEASRLDAPDCAAMAQRAEDWGWPVVRQEAPAEGWPRGPLAVAAWGLPTLAAVVRQGEVLSCGTMRDARRRDPRFTAGVGAVLHPAVGSRDPVEVWVTPSYSALWPAVVHIGDPVDALRADRLRWMLRTGVVAALLVLLASTALAFGSTRPGSLMVFMAATAGFLVWSLEVSGLAGYPQRWLAPQGLHFLLMVALPLPIVAGFAHSLLIQADVERHHHRSERLSLGFLLASLLTLPLLAVLPRTAVASSVAAIEVLLLLICIGLLGCTVTVWRKRRDALTLALAVVPFTVVIVGSLVGSTVVQVWKIELVLLCGAWLAIVSHLVAARRQSRVNRDLELMKHLASTDDLTGLPNRRAVLAALDVEFARARSRGDPVGLPIAVLDLDHFKRINDSLGHPIGDRCLVHFARSVQPLIRRGDMIGRTGGEEFVLLLPGATLEEAARILEKIRKTLARATDVGGHPIVLHFSAGLTDAAGHPNPEAALQVADRLLYRAKDEGRERVVCDRLLPQTQPRPQARPTQRA